MVQGRTAIFMAASHRKWEPFENRVARQDVSMPRCAGMRESGVRMVREKAMDVFFNNLLSEIPLPAIDPVIQVPLHCKH